MFDLKNEEILIYFFLIIVGYYIAKMFRRRCNGFSVGGQLNNTCYRYTENLSEVCDINEDNLNYDCCSILTSSDCDISTLNNTKLENSILKAKNNCTKTQYDDMEIMKNSDKQFNTCFFPDPSPTACNATLYPWNNSVYCNPKWGYDDTACIMTGNMGFDGDREICVERSKCKSTMNRGNNP
jgi:hypothetical protein